MNQVATENRKVVSPSPRLAKVDASFPAMGTLFEIVLLHENERLLRGLLNEIQEEVERLERKLSHYLPTSEVTRINRLAAQKPLLIDYEMFEILETALDYWHRTRGAFDITVGPLLRKWGFYSKNYHAVDISTMRELLQRVGSDQVVLDLPCRTIFFKQPGVEIDLGAMGKGYAVREVVALICKAGVEHGLVSFGGSSIYALGDMPGRTGWHFGFRYSELEDVPPGEITLRDEAFSLSGNTVQKFREGDKTFGHILDPVSGFPVDRIQAVVVAHGSPVVAEMLSTAMMVLGPEKGQPILESEGARAIFAVKAREGVVLEDVNFAEV